MGVGKSKILCALAETRVRGWIEAGIKVSGKRMAREIKGET